MFFSCVGLEVGVSMCVKIVHDPTMQGTGVSGFSALVHPTPQNIHHTLPNCDFLVGHSHCVCCVCVALIGDVTLIGICLCQPPCGYEPDMPSAHAVRHGRAILVSLTGKLAPSTCIFGCECASDTSHAPSWFTCSCIVYVLVERVVLCVCVV